VLPERPLSAAGSLSSLSSLSAPSEDGLDTSSPLGAAADQSLAAAAAVAAAAPPAEPAVPADAQRQQDASDAEHRPPAVPPGMQRIPDGTAKHEAPADPFAPSPPLQQPQAAAPAQHDTPTAHQAWDAADSPMSPRALPDAIAQQNGGADAGAGGQSSAAAASEAMGALLQPEQLSQPRVQQAHEVALARAEALERNLLSGEHVGLLNELPNSIHSSGCIRCTCLPQGFLLSTHTGSAVTCHMHSLHIPAGEFLDRTPLLTWSLKAKHTAFCLAAGPQQPKAVDDASRRAGLQARIAAATTISWPAGGHADHNGAIVGGSVLLRVDRATALDSHATEQQRKVAAHCQVRTSAAHAIVSKAVAL